MVSPEGPSFRPPAWLASKSVSPTIALASDSLAVFPGSEISCELRVHNSGTVVDEFTFEVLGDAAPWTTVEPAALSLFPGAEGVVQLRFQPPRSPDIPAGRVAFAVKVLSREEPEGSVVEEGVVEVGAFSDSFAELIPRTSRGRRAATHQLAFDNRGNAVVNATLAALDPDEQLNIALDPPALVADAGAASFTKVKVAPRKRFLRGPPATHPFQVIVQSDGQPPTPVDGSMLQEPLLPPWLPRALAGLLALLLALVLLWLTVLKPTVKSAAKDAVKEEVQPQLDQANAEQAKNAAATQELAQKVTGTTLPVLTPVPPVTTAAPPTNPLGDPFDERLDVGLNPGTAGEAKFAVPDGRRLSLTDVVLQNPLGDIGTLEIRRGGDVILRVALANFRDLDYHFVSPIVFPAKSELVLAVRCDNPAAPPRPGGNGCAPGASFAGFIKA